MSEEIVPSDPADLKLHIKVREIVKLHLHCSNLQLTSTNTRVVELTNQLKKMNIRFENIEDRGK
jgi:hypothetical protein